MNIQNKRHILLSLDTIMSWANEQLPEDDIYGWIDGYGKMPANPELYERESERWFDFERIIDEFISGLHHNLPKDQAEYYESLIRKVPYEEL